MQLNLFAALLALALVGASFAAPLPVNFRSDFFIGAASDDIPVQDSYSSALTVRAPAQDDTSKHGTLTTKDVDNEDDQVTAMHLFSFT